MRDASGCTWCPDCCRHLPRGDLTLEIFETGEMDTPEPWPETSCAPQHRRGANLRDRKADGKGENAFLYGVERWQGMGGEATR